MRVLRYLAVKEKRVSPKAFEHINELDRLSQLVRHDPVRAILEDKDFSLGELERRVGQAIKDTLA